MILRIMSMPWRYLVGVKLNYACYPAQKMILRKFFKTQRCIFYHSGRQYNEIDKVFSDGKRLMNSFKSAAKELDKTVT